MTVLTPEQFAGQFDDAFTMSAFRLELLDHYIAPNEIGPFREFLSGQTPDPAWREPWKGFVRGARQLGKHMARVHVFTEPHTDYARFELTCVYPANVDAGEDVRILPRREAVALDLPGRDFWLLDSSRAAVMDYDDAGNWLRVELVDDPADVARYCQARDVAMAHAVPLNTYLGQNRTKEQYERRAS